MKLIYDIVSMFYVLDGGVCYIPNPDELSIQSPKTRHATKCQMAFDKYHTQLGL